MIFQICFLFWVLSERKKKRKKEKSQKRDWVMVGWVTSVWSYQIWNWWGWLVFWCILLMRIGFGFCYFWFCVFDLTVVWILLVDYGRIVVFDHSFVCVFDCLVAKKMQEKRRKSWIFNFLGNHVFRKEHEEQSIIFWARTCRKNLNDLPTKQWIEKKRKFYFNYLIIT